jgi:chromosome segregation ATPase
VKSWETYIAGKQMLAARIDELEQEAKDLRAVIRAQEKKLEHERAVRMNAEFRRDALDTALKAMRADKEELEKKAQLLNDRVDALIGFRRFLGSL